MLPERALSPNNCGEHARGKDGTACRWGKRALVRSFYSANNSDSYLPERNARDITGLTRHYTSRPVPLLCSSESSLVIVNDLAAGEIESFTKGEAIALCWVRIVDSAAAPTAMVQAG